MIVMFLIFRVCSHTGLKRSADKVFNRVLALSEGIVITAGANTINILSSRCFHARSKADTNQLNLPLFPAISENHRSGLSILYAVSIRSTDVSATNSLEDMRANCNSYVKLRHF